MAEQRVGLCQQTFVADDKFGDVIACLEARGWARVLCGGDLAWRNLKQTDFESADADRYVNHLRHAQRLSHKATLAAALADASAEFYPRCYDLRLPAHARRFLGDAARVAAAAALRAGGAGPGDAGLGRTLVDACAGRNFDEIAARLAAGDTAATLAARTGGGDAVAAAAALRAFDARPQAAVVDGAAGVWVLKPAGGSCGEGVVCSTSVQELLAAAMARRWRVVVQKYIERPLTPLARKFDVRQWVLLSAVRPKLVLWGFSEAYARFAQQRFALSDASLRDKFAHLCNYSIQKDAPAADDAIAENMWSQAQLAAHIDRIYGAGSFEARVRAGIRAIAVAVAETAARLDVEKVGHGFEWLGLDIIVGEDLSCYLLEANVSPDVSHSTAVTAALVPAATEDALALLLDEGHAADTDAPVAARRRSTLYGDPPPTPADGPAAAPRWELWLRASAPAPAEQLPARLTDGRADAWWRAELARLERFAPPPPDASSDEEL